jgi:agmatine deiminase
MNKIITTFVALLLSSAAFTATAQHLDLPKGFAPGEQELIPAYNEWRQSRVVVCDVDAPSESVRNMAEWEELQGLAITWTSYIPILTQIVAAAKEQTQVIIICSNDAVVKNQLGAAGVDWTTGITFIEDDFNSVWIRDYGPNTIYLNEVETVAFVDWIYNRPRPKDDVVPEVISDALGIPLYCTTTAPTDLVHTGGNYMSDGLGMAFSSTLVLEENDETNVWGTSNHSEEEINQIMSDYMGINIYPKMEALPYDLIHHIDMHMKLLDERTLLVGEYPQGVADGPQIEANIQYVLDNYATSNGSPFKVIRIPMPPDNGQYPDQNGDYRTYANAVFVNKTILVPTYEAQYDEPALAIWEEAMPGYNVVGINCNAIIPASGAIHCITKEIGADNPLWISHFSLDDQEASNNAYPVVAQIKHKEGVSNATLFFKTDLAGSYSEVAMSNMGNDLWEAGIPGQIAGTTVYYYIHAEATDGKQQVRPMPAPEGYFKFNVTGGTTATTDLQFGDIRMQAAFPNPASAITCIPVSSAGATEATIQLTDVFGRKVSVLFEGILPAGESKYFIDAGALTAGTYFIELHTTVGTKTQTLLVK